VTGAEFPETDKSACVFSNHLHAPRDTFFTYTRSGREFEDEFNKATHINGGLWAGYCPQGTDHVSDDLVSRALKWCDSPLSVTLQKRSHVRSDIYAKAVLHLHDFQLGKQDSLANFNQMMAWKRVSERPGNGTTELLERLAKAR
jgi:hypothetical protein